MTEQPSKPESAEKELSIDEFLEILRKKFKPDESYIKTFFVPFLERNSIRFIRVRNIADKFESMSEKWNRSTLPLYDKGLDILFLLRSGLHENLMRELYLIETGKTGDELARHGIRPDNWIAACKGWYVSGMDFALVKSHQYRGSGRETDIFLMYTNIQDMDLGFEK